MSTPSNADASYKILTRPDSATIAYNHLKGISPGVVFLDGFMSDMTGSKALALVSCPRNTHAYFWDKQAT